MLDAWGQRDSQCARSHELTVNVQLHLQLQSRSFYYPWVFWPQISAMAVMSFAVRLTPPKAPAVLNCCCSCELSDPLSLFRRELGPFVLFRSLLETNSIGCYEPSSRTEVTESPLRSVWQAVFHRCTFLGGVPLSVHWCLVKPYGFRLNNTEPVHPSRCTSAITHKGFRVWALLTLQTVCFSPAI